MGGSECLTLVGTRAVILVGGAFSTARSTHGDVPTETIDAPRRDGEVAGREDARATSVFSDDRQTPTCLHERPHDGITWGPALTVTLTKVE